MSTKQPPAKTAKQKLTEAGAKLRKQIEAKKAADAKKAAKPPKVEKAPKTPEPTPEPLAVIVESVRPIADILGERVKILDGWKGVEISADTTIEEYLPIFDHFATTYQHAGFMIGDVIRHGANAYGKTYEQAMLKTGRALSTLQKCKSVADRIPIAIRTAHPMLGYSHCVELSKLADVGKIEALVDEMVKDSAKPNHTFPTVKEVRAKVAKLKPKPKAPKAKKNEPKPPPPRNIQPDEEHILRRVMDAAEALEDLLTGADLNNLTTFLYAVHNKHRIPLNQRLRVICGFAAVLEKKTE